MDTNAYCTKPTVDVTQHIYIRSLIQLHTENIVAKGEIARFVQFLLLSLCFQKAYHQLFSERSFDQ